MLGHEHIKASLLAYLAVAVPERLAVLRDRLSVTDPVDPVSYVAADSLAFIAEYPTVLVRSTSMSALKSAGVVTAGATAPFAAGYSLEVVVACDAGTHGDYAAACADRDRLLLAVREALLLAGQVGDGITLQTAGLTEQTGAAAESFQGRPLAAGSVSLSAVVVEVLAPGTGSVTETADAFDTTYNVYSADQSIP